MAKKLVLAAFVLVVTIVLILDFLPLNSTKSVHSIALDAVYNALIHK